MNSKNDTPEDSTKKVLDAIVLIKHREKQALETRSGEGKGVDLEALVSKLVQKKKKSE